MRALKPGIRCEVINIISRLYVFKIIELTRAFMGCLMKRLVVFLGYDEKSNAVLKRVSQIKHLFDDVSIIHVPEVDSEALRRLSIPYIKIEFDEFSGHEDLVTPSGKELDKLFVEMLLK